LKKNISYISVITFFVALNSGCNPFAPKFDESTGDQSGTISDLKTIDGVFQNLQYSYTFKDTLIYGELIAEDFVFTYRDYERGFDVSWGRDDEMKVTSGIFLNTERLELIWNNIVLSSSDSLSATIIRGFNLTITYNPTSIERADGRVNLTLRKNQSTSKWQIVGWLDESNF
jgi:hypothetical protein